MQAVLLAAGQSSRFNPFNRTCHKSFTTVLGKPIIQHTLESIRKTGITDILIVVQKINEDCTRLRQALPDLNITFIQQTEPKGMGDALLQVAEAITGDFFLTHAHHADFDDFASEMMDLKKEADGVLLAKEDAEPHKYGVLRLENDKVVEIVEKPIPGTEPSRLRLLGIYLLPQSFLTTLHDTPLEHYNFESALSQFAREHTFRVAVTHQQSITLKYPWELFFVTDYLLQNRTRSISKKAVIASSATIEGEVTIEDGAVISDGARIKGPCFIGRNVFIGDNSIIRNNAVIEEGCVIGAHTEVRNSIFMEGTKIHSGFVGDSIIGRNVRLAASFHTANRRLDRGKILVKTDNGEVDSGLTSLGVIVGDKTRMGIRVTTMPGIMIGEHAIIGPTTTVMKNVPDKAKYYTVFKEVVEKHDKDKS